MEESESSIWNRKGRFSLDRRFIVSEPEVAKKIMGECVIIRAEGIFMDELVLYDAISDLFDPVPAGCFIPEYIAIAHKDEGGVTIKFEKK